MVERLCLSFYITLFFISNFITLTGEGWSGFDTACTWKLVKSSSASQPSVTPAAGNPMSLPPGNPMSLYSCADTHTCARTHIYTRTHNFKNKYNFKVLDVRSRGILGVLVGTAK